MEQMTTTTEGGSAVVDSTQATPKTIKMESTRKNIQVLPLEVLSVDRAYQRPATRKMEEMGKAWNPNLANVITVSLREDGTHWIIDGQHRVGAALIAGETQLEADVRENLTIADEARLFDQLNMGRTHVSAIDRFKARLLYEDPTALEIQKITEEFGGEIADSMGQQKGNDTRLKAVRALELTYEQVGPTGLREILSIITESWGGVDSVTTNETTLSGLRQLWNRRLRKMDRDRLIERMKEEGLSTLKRQAHAHGQIFGGSGPLNFYRAVVEAYNKNLTARQRIKP